MTEEEALQQMDVLSDYFDGWSRQDSIKVYETVIRHLLQDVINPKDSARGIIFALQRKHARLIERLDIL